MNRERKPRHTNGAKLPTTETDQTASLSHYIFF